MISEARGGLSGADNINPPPARPLGGLARADDRVLGCSDSMVFNRCLSSDVRHILLGLRLCYLGVARLRIDHVYGAHAFMDAVKRLRVVVKF